MQISKSKLYSLVASGLIFFSSLAFAQYPNKTIKFVLSFIFEKNKIHKNKIIGLIF